MSIIEGLLLWASAIVALVFALIGIQNLCEKKKCKFCNGSGKTGSYHIQGQHGYFDCPFCKKQVDGKDS
jgi:hypothetical protein